VFLPFNIVVKLATTPLSKPGMYYKNLFLRCNEKKFEIRAMISNILFQKILKMCFQNSKHNKK
jgi:hypothetical protein